LIAAPRLTEPPVDRQVVIAPFEDGNSYRARVLETYNDNKAKIVYIDFGNTAIIDIKDLKVMPQCHLQVQLMIFLHSKTIKKLRISLNIKKSIYIL